MKRILFALWHNAPDRNLGLVWLRAAVGIAMLTHGLPKLSAGPETWERLGSHVTNLGVPGPAVAWGFMAAFAESIGAILLALGLLTPLAAFLIACTMGVAAFVVHAGAPFARRELALLYFACSVFFVFKGGGSYAVDRFLPRPGR